MPPKRARSPSKAPQKKRRRTKAPSLRPDGTPRTSFLCLPPELRNEVYSLALLQDTPIKVNRRLKEPKLLLACREIRAEAIKIWYLGNKFEVKVHSCNATLLVAFQKHVKQFDVWDWDKGIWKSPIQVKCLTTGFKNWDRLEDWCKQIFRAQLPILPPSDRGSRLGLAITAAHAIVDSSLARSGGSWTKNGSWTKCRAALRALRATLGNYDGRWLN